MREGWNEIKLGEIIKSVKGKKPPSLQSEQVPGLPYLTADVLRGADYCQYIRQIDLVDTVRLDGSETIILWDGAGAGDIFRSRVGVLASTMAKIQSTSESQLSADFLYLLIKNAENEIKAACRGTTVPHVSPDSIANLRVQVPGIPEQKRIVDLVSTIDSYITALEKQMSSARNSRNALKEKMLLSVSDSPLLKLGDVTTKIGSGATPRGGEQVYIPEGITFIRSQNIHDVLFVHDGLVAITGDAASALKGVTVHANDVLINITGASVTRCCLVDNSVLPARVNQHVAIIRTNPKILRPAYLAQVLTSHDMKSHLNDLAGNGSTRQALTKQHLQELEICIPTLSKQDEIVNLIASFDQYERAMATTLASSTRLRSGLLSDLLKGEHEIPTNYKKMHGAA